MTETHAKQRHIGFFNNVRAETEVIRLLWMTRSWRDHYSVELLLLELIPGNLVIFHDERRLVANFCKEMNEIVSERVVVIDDHQSHAAPDHERFSFENKGREIESIRLVLEENANRRCDVGLIIPARIYAAE